MVALQYSFRVDTVAPLAPKWGELTEGVFIVVIHANKIPPHIGVLSNGLFYSLKAKGKDVGVRLSTLKEILTKKEIATLFFEVKNGLNFHHGVEQVFTSIGSEIVKGTTCLSPLLTIFNTQATCRTVADLLSELEKNDHLGSVFGAFLPEAYEGIPYYDVNSIQDRINKLKDGK